MRKNRKYIIFLVFFLFIFFTNKINANSDSINYNDTIINTIYFNQHQNAFLIYDKIDNKYLSFELFRTSSSSNSNPRFYIVREDKDYMYISGRSNQYFFNCTAIYNYNISSGTIGSVSSSTNYGGNTTSTDSKNSSYKIDKNRYSFVYKADNVKIYTDETCITENTTSEFFNIIKAPSISNTPEDLATGNFDYVLVMPGSLSPIDNIGLKLNKVNTIKYDLDGDGTEEEHESLELLYKTQLNSYLKSLDDLFWYEFPQNAFGVNFKEGDRFCLQLVNDIDKIYLDDDYVLYQQIYFTIGGLTEDDKANNRVNVIVESNKRTEEAIKNQTEAIKEQTETNKGIWETIKSIVNFINPLSKDFFVYKLVDLLIDALKSLFVPSDDFFNNWFSDLNSWLGDRFGILYFPTEIVLDFLNRIGSLSDSSECILHVPSFDINFFGTNITFFSGFDYDFNSLLSNDTLKNIHSIYLLVVDVILYLCLIILSHNSFVEVFGGHYIDDALHDGYDYYEKSNIEKKQKEKSNRIGFRG